MRRRLHRRRNATRHVGSTGDASSATYVNLQHKKRIISFVFRQVSSSKSAWSDPEPRFSVIIRNEAKSMGRCGLAEAKVRKAAKRLDYKYQTQLWETALLLSIELALFVI